MLKRTMTHTDGGKLRIPWLRLATLALLLVVFVSSLQQGRRSEAAIVGVIALVPIGLLVAWFLARSLTHSQGDDH